MADDDTFKHIFLNENVKSSIKVSLNMLITSHTEHRTEIGVANRLLLFFWDK